MIFDASCPFFHEHDPEELPNVEAQHLYELLQAAQQSLWSDCTTHYKLSIVLHMLNIKINFNMSWDCFNQFLVLLKKLIHKKI